MNKFKALHDTESGEITILPDRVEFHFLDPTKESFSISNLYLQIEVVGVNSSHYLLRHRTEPQKSIIVQDEKALALLINYGIKSAKQALYSGKKKKYIAYSIVLGSFFATVLALYIIPWTASALPTKWLNTLIPPSRESYLRKFFTESLSDRLSDGLSNSNSDRMTDSKTQRPVNGLDSILKIFEENNPELKQFEIIIHKSTDDSVNAFATPGSIIMVNSGLINKAENIHEVVGVIAHEIGHIIERHPMRLLIRNAGVVTGFGVLGVLVGVDSIQYLGGIEKILYLKNSRQHETEADEIGVQLLQRSKLSAHGLMTFFDKLRKEEDSMGGVVKGTLSLLSTHPLSGDRSKHIESLISQDSDISNDSKLPNLKDL